MFSLGDKRVLSQTVQGDVCIRDADGKKAIFLSARSWSGFVQLMDDIDDAVKSKEEIAYCRHFGGGWYVSVTSGFSCVDIRRFYMKDGSIKPTKTGIALRLNEWEILKLMLPHLSPAVGQCWHKNHEDFLRCLECCPFGQ
jgi:hypothetical protein